MSRMHRGLIRLHAVLAIAAVVWFLNHPAKIKQLHFGPSLEVLLDRRFELGACLYGGGRRAAVTGFPDRQRQKPSSHGASKGSEGPGRSIGRGLARAGAHGGHDRLPTNSSPCCSLPS